MEQAENGDGGRPGRVLTLRDLPMPADTITDDYISAGWILSKMDLAGGRRAYQYIRGRSVTVGIDAMSFRKPIFIGDQVSVYTDVVAQGRTSLTVHIESLACRRTSGLTEKVTEGYFTFVAIDSERKPVEIKTQSGLNVFPKRILGSDLAVSPDARPEMTTRLIPMPRDVNYLGDVFGGWILSNMDLAGAKAAEKIAGRMVATVGLEAMTFYKPVLVGDEVSFLTRLVRVGNSSVTISVETRSVRRHGGDDQRVTEGVFTYVAVDKNRKPVSFSA